MTDNAESPDAGEELVDDSRDIALDTSDETELTETPSQGVSELRETMAQQDSEAEKYAIEFLKKVIRIRGVRISREGFLHQELRKLHMSDDAIASAIDSNPVLAGVELTQLDGLADSIISFETNKSTAMSFAAGIPGGFAMLGTIPADLMQYYVHAFRVMQKLAYLYGWRELLTDMDEVDDETVGVLAMFFGVMLGVGGAAQSLTMFARSVAMPAFQKQLTKQALTKTSWYPVVKQCLRFIGINLTKKSFAQGVSKVIPVIGGVVSGGMTYVSLRSQSSRLKGHLRELPPPGVDAEAWKQSVSGATPEETDPGILQGAQQAIKGTTKVVSDSAMSAASGAADSIKGFFGRGK
ncbi:EcsC family protein [Schaalia meyeri]|uniref:EcsC family protein n=1 Tax=Schaalia meyeri TaxID=52773 RepID=UPI0009E36304|nr:EcsC family protein [Schaalia meyeri]